MTITLPTATHTTSVRVSDGVARFDGFVESDPAVVDALAAAPDPEAAAHDLLALGGRLSGLAAGAGSLRELEARVGERLERLTESSRLSVEAATSQLCAAHRDMFDPTDGRVGVALAAWRSDLEGRLGEMFDPEHKRSVIAAIESSVSAVLETQARRLINITDPDNPQSGAARLLAQMRQGALDLQAELHALAVAVGTQQGRAAEHSRTAIKGADYEHAVVAAVTSTGAAFGDRVDHVGTTTGVKGNRKGDVLVTLSADDADDGRYVLEAKDTAMSLRATWRELDAAAANRDAQAAIAVFASGDLAPASVPFLYNGHRAIVVLDRDDPDPSALQLACLWARWVVRRSQLPAGTGPDPERVRAAVDAVQRALTKVTQIRRDHSVASRALDGARGHLDEMVGDVRAALADLVRELGA